MNSPPSLASLRREVVAAKEEGSRFGHFGGFVLDFTMFIY